jgi:hypothetical protein
VIINKDYQLRIKRGALVFSTASFRAEGESVLPVMIYNRELTSSLAAGAVVVLIAVALAYAGVRFSIAHYIAGAVIFGLLMLVFRLYLFVEERIEAVLDPERNRVLITINGLRGGDMEAPLSDLRSIRKGYMILVPENQDGIGVVERISSQHGMAVQGLGNPKEFHSVVFEFQDGTPVTVFTSDDINKTATVLEIMKNFIGEIPAKAD